MLKIGLTGGIGSGKSTVAAFFGALGVPVIDADVIARQLVEPGSPAFREIVRVFGDAVLDTHGELNRARLREIAFGETERRRELESILHPRILAEMESQVAGLQAPYCVLCLPLLIEAHLTDRVDRVLVVIANRELRCQRVIAHRGLSRTQIDAIMDTQTDDTARLALADDVIQNEDSADALQAQVEALHARYLRLAAVSD